MYLSRLATYWSILVLEAEEVFCRANIAYLQRHNIDENPLPTACKVIRHEAPQGRFSQTYHYNMTHAETGEPEIIVIKITSSVRSPDLSTSLSSRESTSNGLEDVTPGEWVCAFTVGCFVATRNFGRRTAIITVNAANAAAASLADWFEHGANWQHYVADKVVDFTITIPADIKAVFVQNAIQRLLSSAENTCVADNKTLVQLAVAEALREATVGVCNGDSCVYYQDTCYMKGDTRSRTYVHRAQTAPIHGINPPGQALAHAISFSDNDDSTAQTLNC